MNVNVKRDGDIGVLIQYEPVEIKLDLKTAREFYEKLGIVLKDSEARNRAFDRRNKDIKLLTSVDEDPPDGYYVEPCDLEPSWWRWGRKDGQDNWPGPGRPLALSRIEAVAACKAAQLVGNGRV